MYRTPSFVGRQSILRTRSHVNTNNTQGLLEKHNAVLQARGGKGRFMSSEGSSSGSSSNFIRIASFSAGVVPVATIYGAYRSKEFRETVESYVPGASSLFSVILPNVEKPADEDLPSLLPVKKTVNVPDPDEPIVGETPKTVSVLKEEPAEQLEQASVEEVAFIEPTKSEPVAEDSVAQEGTSDVMEEVAEEALANEVAIEAVVDDPGLDVETTIVEPAVVVESVSPVLLEESNISAEKLEVPVIEESDYVVIEGSTEINEEDAAKLAIGQEIQRQTQILTTSYQNIRIILEDTITTKSSAVRMLHGYISQFSQALLVGKQDPAYASIWDAISAVAKSIQESMDLVKTKETEAQGQVQIINGVVSDIRTYGSCDIADNAEKLITSSYEHLAGCETEITALNMTVEILVGLRERIETSPERLQNYLRGFIPDLMKLLSTKDLAALESLSSQDALLMLSLQRPSLVYAEQEAKDAEKQAELEVTIEQQKQEVWKEAELHLANVLDQVNAEKSEEFEERVNGLKQEFALQLKEELKAQQEAHQQRLAEENAKLEAELSLQHIADMETKLAEQAEEHKHEIETNISSLNAIESKIVDVLSMEKRSQKNQRLWAAAQALYDSLNNIVEEGRTKKLSVEIPNVLQIDENDPLLAQIVSVVPERAAENGVVPETVLIQNFKEKKRICKRVAAVEGADASFFVYVASVLKSYFVPSKILYYGKLTDDVNVEKLNAYEILEHADYYVSTGDLEQAAKLMAQLNGVARKLCADWVEEVRLLLETKQATNLLMAYVGSLVVGFE